MTTIDILARGKCTVSGCAELNFGIIGLSILIITIVVIAMSSADFIGSIRHDRYMRKHACRTSSCDIAPEPGSDHCFRHTKEHA